MWKAVQFRIFSLSSLSILTSPQGSHPFIFFFLSEVRTKMFFSPPHNPLLPYSTSNFIQYLYVKHQMSFWVLPPTFVDLFFGFLTIHRIGNVYWHFKHWHSIWNKMSGLHLWKVNVIVATSATIYRLLPISQIVPSTLQTLYNLIFGTKLSHTLSLVPNCWK